MLLYNVSASDEGRAEDINQLSRTLRNVLGVQADDQDAAGKWVLPSAAAAPGSPAEAMRYYSTTELIQYLRNGSSVWVPERPLRQVTRPDPALVDSYYPEFNTYGGDQKWDVQDERVITLTGSGVLVMAALSVGSFGDFWQDVLNNGVEVKGDIGILIKRGRDIVFQATATLIELHDVGLSAIATNHFSLMFYDEPGPGTYTYSLSRKTTFTQNSAQTKHPEDTIWNQVGAPLNLHFLEV